MTEEQPNPHKTMTRWRWLAPLTLIGILLTLYLTGVFDDVDAASIKAQVLSSGPLGPIVFILMLAGLQPLYVSVYVFLFAGLAVWGPWEALIYCWVGIQGACLWPFLLTRRLKGDRVIPDSVPEKARPLLETMGSRGFPAVFVSRLLFYTATPVQWAYGLTPVKTRDFVAGTAIGTIPLTGLTLFVGDAGFTWWQLLSQREQISLGAIAIGLALIAPVIFWFWSRRSSEATDP